MNPNLSTTTHEAQPQQLNLRLNIDKQFKSANPRRENQWQVRRWMDAPSPQVLNAMSGIWSTNEFHAKTVSDDTSNYSLNTIQRPFHGRHCWLATDWHTVYQSLWIIPKQKEVPDEVASMRISELCKEGDTDKEALTSLIDCIAELRPPALTSDGSNLAQRRILRSPLSGPDRGLHDEKGGIKNETYCNLADNPFTAIRNNDRHKKEGCNEWWQQYFIFCSRKVWKTQFKTLGGKQNGNVSLSHTASNRTLKPDLVRSRRFNCWKPHCSLSNCSRPRDKEKFKLNLAGWRHARRSTQVSIKFSRRESLNLEWQEWSRVFMVMLILDSNTHSEASLRITLHYQAAQITIWTKTKEAMTNWETSRRFLWMYGNNTINQPDKRVQSAVDFGQHASILITNSVEWTDINFQHNETLQQLQVSSNNNYVDVKHAALKDGIKIHNSITLSRGKTPLKPDIGQPISDVMNSQLATINPGNPISLIHPNVKKGQTYFTSAERKNALLLHNSLIPKSDSAITKPNVTLPDTLSAILVQIPNVITTGEGQYENEFLGFVLDSGAAERVIGPKQEKLYREVKTLP